MEKAEARNTPVTLYVTVAPAGTLHGVVAMLQPLRFAERVGEPVWLKATAIPVVFETDLPVKVRFGESVVSSAGLTEVFVIVKV